MRLLLSNRGRSLCTEQGTDPLPPLLARGATRGDESKAAALPGARL